MNSKRLINHFNNVLKISHEQESFIPEFFFEYVDKGTENFQKKIVVWDDEEIVDYDLLYVLTAYSYRFAIPKDIVDFINENNTNAFIKLLNSYFTDQLLQTYAYKTNQFISGVLHTDLALSTLFSLGYFPDKAETMVNHLINFLESSKSRLDIYPSSLDFGFKSTLYLVSVLFKDAGYLDCFEKITHFLKTPEKSYEFAYQNLYSSDEETINRWVNELTDFHIKNSKDDLTMPFNRERWQYFPIEIITLLQLRSQKGLPIDFIKHPLLKDFLPFISQQLPIPLDETTQQLESRILGK
jgi:hypothetical protein